MTFEHQWSSHYKENDRLPERRGTYLSEFLIFTRTAKAKAHPLTKHLSMRSIEYFFELYAFILLTSTLVLDIIYTRTKDVN